MTELEKIKKKFETKFWNARRYKIHFELTLDDYIQKMQEAGITVDQIGRGSAQYNLARYKDEGGYTTDNCRFLTHSQNMEELQATDKWKAAVKIIHAKSGNRMGQPGKPKSEVTRERMKVAQQRKWAGKKKSQNPSAVYCRKWKAEHRDKILDYNRRWRLKNPEKMQAYREKQNARRALTNSLEDVKR